MSTPPDLRSWLLANLEAGSDTDVIQKEQLWESFSKSASTMGSAMRMNRDKFFSELGEAFSTNVFKEVKTVRKNGKKVGFRCLRVRTEHRPVDVKGQNVVSLEGVEKSDGWKQLKRNAFGDPSDPQECRQTKQFKTDDALGVSSAFKETEAGQSIEDEESCGSGHMAAGANRSPEGQTAKLKKKKKVKLVRKRVSGDRFKEKEKKKRSKTSKLSVRKERCGGHAVLSSQVGGTGVGEKRPILQNDLDHDTSWSHAIGDDESTEVVNVDGEDTHIETPSTLLWNADERADNSDKESCDIGTTHGFVYGDSLDDDDAFNNDLEKKVYASDDDKSAGTSKLGAEESMRSPRPGHEARADSELFYRTHYKAVKSLLPKHLPGSPKSFRDYLSQRYLIPDGENVIRWEIHKRSGETNNYSDVRCRAFLATAFPPVNVGSLAGKEVEHTFNGDIFPQFSQLKKTHFQCELCVPYQKWAIKNGSKHASLKSSSANLKKIMDGTAELSFSGVVQAHEHFESKAHQEAIEFFRSNDRNDERKKNIEDAPKKKRDIQDFFKPKKPLN